MLLRFSVENALCFGAETSLSMVATSDDRHPSHICSSRKGAPDVLRIATLYGANGHGKTNLVRSISTMKNIVVQKKWNLPRFKLDKSYSKSPSRLVMEFIHKETIYEYGVVVDGKVIKEEWLFSTNKTGKEKKIFERITHRKDEVFVTEISPGPSMKRMKSPVEGLSMEKYMLVLSAGLKESRPFLSESKERSLPLFDDPYEWFSSILTPVEVTSSYAPLFERVGADDDFRRFLETFMKRCDVGIEGLRAKTAKVAPAALANFPSIIRDEIQGLDNNEALKIEHEDGITMVFEKDEEGELLIRNIDSLRHDSDGDEVSFSFDEESSGTRRLMDLAPMLADNSAQQVFVVDELDRKLHPMLSYKFVQEFLCQNKGQLILTTHNTHLMDLDLLRRDEIWFVQKKGDGSSDMYSLADMKVRPDLNVKKGYINGRFGAIPFLGSFPAQCDSEVASDDHY
ncbi:AAA family ATPase [Asaia siamensis]